LVRAVRGLWGPRGTNEELDGLHQRQGVIVYDSPLESIFIHFQMKIPAQILDQEEKERERKIQDRAVVGNASKGTCFLLFWVSDYHSKGILRLSARFNRNPIQLKNKSLSNSRRKWRKSFWLLKSA
jgi:hypothetical protein